MYFWVICHVFPFLPPAQIFYFLKLGLCSPLKFVFCSYVYAARKIVSSSNGFEISWNPIGNPFESTSHGMLIPGNPPMFTGTVQISAKYISSGFETFSPFLNAVVGDTGVNNKSYFSNNSLYAFLINVLTF